MKKITWLDVLLAVKANPGVDTRELIKYLAKKHNDKKQRVCGFLSSLKRSGQIYLDVIVPRKETKAY